MVAALWILGSVSGIVYVVLGVMAINNAAAPGWRKEMSYFDATLWWFLWWDCYNERGRRLCVYGALVFMVGVALWVTVYYLQRQ